MAAQSAETEAGFEAANEEFVRGDDCQASQSDLQSVPMQECYAEQGQAKQDEVDWYASHIEYLVTRGTSHD
jgi:uncharacterized protein HemX